MNIIETETNKVLLIDLENCPSQINQLMENLEHYAHVVICYAQSGAKIPIDWVIPLTPTVSANKLRIEKMSSMGKNSADFGIAFWAGVLMMEFPQGTHFDIISNDADLDHVVNLLKNQGRTAERIGMKKNNDPSVTSFTENNGQKQNNYLQIYCTHLHNHSKSRPAKKETLLNNIKSKFKADDINPDEIFNSLNKHGVIEVKDNKILYNQSTINKFACP